MPRMKTGVKKRVRKLKSEGLDKASAKTIARKRAKTYKANVKRTGLKSGGKKGSLKRDVFRYGDKEDAARLKDAKKNKQVKQVKANAKIARGLKSQKGRRRGVIRVEELRYQQRKKASKNAPAKPDIKKALSTLKPSKSKPKTTHETRKVNGRNVSKRVEQWEIEDRAKRAKKAKGPKYPQGKRPNVKPKPKNVKNVKPKSKTKSQSDRAKAIFDDIKKGAGL